MSFIEKKKSREFKNFKKTGAELNQEHGTSLLRKEKQRMLNLKVLKTKMNGLKKEESAEKLTLLRKQMILLKSLK
jgi:hypothetical protein